MNKNKEFINLIILKTKNEDNKKDLIIETINDLTHVFENKLQKDNSSFFDFKFSYETEDESNDSITPEIFSLLEELYLSADTAQYETGSYYTNKRLINRTLEHIPYIINKTVIDPSSGSGNFFN